MFERWIHALRGVVDGKRARADVEALTAFHRIQASPGFDDAASWLERRLGDAGLTVQRDEVPGDGTTRFLGAVMPEGWWCDDARAELLGAAGREFLADWSRSKLSLVQRSAPVTGRFRVVSAGAGTSPADYAGLDVRGAVVLVSGNADRAHRLAVVEFGAAGLLCDGRRLTPPVRTAEHDRDSLAYTSFWWLGDEPRGWGFVISPDRGDELRERLALGEALEVEARIASRRFETRIPLVSATIPGTRPGEVLVTAHLCHPQPGANDNGSGVAAALETARALAALRASGEFGTDSRTVRFLWMPELTGTHAWIGRDPARAARTVAAINLDMVGESQVDCGSTLLLEHPPHFAGSFAEELLARIRHAAQDWVTSFSGPGHYSMARMAEVPYSGGSDHAVWLDPAIGVPCPMLIQWPDRYYHSSLDTIERVDPASLALAARSAAAYAAFLATAGEREASWLLGLVGRGARRRILAAMDHPSARRAAESEKVRGWTALASVGRLAIGEGEAGARSLAGRVALAAEELEGFFDSEVEPALPARTPRSAHASARVPVRVVGAPLEMLRHLLPGWRDRSPMERARWYGLAEAAPGGTTALDVAWYAVDGRRSVDDVAALVEAECGDGPLEWLDEFFDAAAALGLCRWREG